MGEPPGGLGREVGAGGSKGERGLDAFGDEEDGAAPAEGDPAGVDPPAGARGPGGSRPSRGGRGRGRCARRRSGPRSHSRRTRSGCAPSRTRSARRAWGASRRRAPMRRGWRALLDGSRTFALAGGRTLAPSLELGLRHDGGDAGTGTGTELGAGLGFTDPSWGLDVALRVYGLAEHAEGHATASGGVSGLLSLVPGGSLPGPARPVHRRDGGGAHRASRSEGGGIARDRARRTTRATQGGRLRRGLPHQLSTTNAVKGVDLRAAETCPGRRRSRRCDDRAARSSAPQRQHPVPWPESCPRSPRAHARSSCA